jgi:hypothetical protein
MRPPKLNPPGRPFLVDDPETERMNRDMLMAAFDLPPGERDRLHAQSRRDKFEELARDELVPRFCLLGDAEFWDRQTKRALTAGGLDRVPEVVARFGHAGNKSPITPHVLLTRQPGVKHIWGTCSQAGVTDEFVTVKDDNGLPVLMANLWTPSEFDPAPVGSADPVEFIEHVRWLTKDADLLFDRLAWWHQNPAAYSPVALLLHGEGGNGKNLVLFLFGQVVGAHNVKEISLASFTSPYNAFLRAAYLKNTEFTLAGDAGQERYEAIKDWTSEANKLIHLNGKYERQTWVRVQPRLMFASNAEGALTHLPEHDRRFLAIGCGMQTKPPSYYENLWALFADPDYVARTSRWLLERNVSAHNAHQAHRSEAREKLMVQALSPMALDAYDLVTSGALAGHRLFTSSEFAAQLPREPTVYEWRAIRAGLDRAGCRELGRWQFLPKRPRVYSGSSSMSGEGHTMTYDQRDDLLSKPDEWRSILEAAQATHEGSASGVSPF